MFVLFEKTTHYFMRNLGRDSVLKVSQLFVISSTQFLSSFSTLLLKYRPTDKKTWFDS